LTVSDETHTRRFIDWRPDGRSRGGTVSALSTGTVEPTQPGAPWWRYRRRGVPIGADEQRRASGEPPGQENNYGPPPRVDPARAKAPRQPAGLEQAAPRARPGLVPGVLAIICVIIVIATGRREIPAVGRVLIPAAGILAALAFREIVVRRHPDEKWLSWLLVLGVIVKLVASAIRYDTLVDEFGGGGDASLYDEWGKRFFRAWDTGGEEPDLTGKGGPGSNWVRWFTGAVYYVFGPDMLNGFLIFGLLAVVGTYFWYRAAAEAVPFLNKRLFFVLVFFLPSVVFWPSSIGKEALMQLGIGVTSLGIAHLMNQRVFHGLLVALPGGWLLWRVRPHLLALVAFSAGVAYLLGRVRRKGAAAESGSLARPIGMLIIAFLVFFAVNEATRFLGMEEFSVNAVEQELAETKAGGDYGGSEFQTDESPLSPLAIPKGIVTVLLRPFPWEVETQLQILASLEGAALGLFILYRFGSVRLSLAQARATPFLLYCWILVLLYAVAFSSISNFGLLVRQRSLALPALLVLLALEPRLTRTPEDGPTFRASGAEAQSRVSDWSRRPQ
jgi:hypothetical protein